MKEIWKKINGYDEYEISNLGRIRSFKKNKRKSAGGFIWKYVNEDFYYEHSAEVGAYE